LIRIWRASVLTENGEEEDIIVPLLTSLQSSLNRGLAGDFLVALYRCERCPATGQSPTEILYLFRVAAAHLQFCCRLMRQTAEMKNYEQNSNSRRRTGYGDGLAR
jgi:hypothetical protein